MLVAETIICKFNASLQIEVFVTRVARFFMVTVKSVSSPSDGLMRCDDCFVLSSLRLIIGLNPSVWVRVDSVGDDVV